MLPGGYQLERLPDILKRGTAIHLQPELTYTPTRASSDLT